MQFWFSIYLRAFWRLQMKFINCIHQAFWHDTAHKVTFYYYVLFSKCGALIDVKCIMRRITWKSKWNIISIKNQNYPVAAKEVDMRPLFYRKASNIVRDNGLIVRALNCVQTNCSLFSVENTIWVTRNSTSKVFLGIISSIQNASKKSKASTG